MATQVSTEPAPDELAPVEPSARLNAIDALRGVALFGVLAINLETEFRVSIFRQFLTAAPEPGLGGMIDAALAIFVDMKAFALFSLLFGVGLAIQCERLARTGRRVALLIRRLLALLGFGLIHLFLIWNGDILTEYAVAGLIALPFLFAPLWLSAGAGAALLALYLAMPYLPPVAALPDAGALAQHVAEADRVYASGSFADVLALRIRELPAILPLHVFVLPRTLGLFLMGMVAWRSGLLRRSKEFAGRLWTFGAVAVAAGLACMFFTVARGVTGWPSPGRLGAALEPGGTILLAFGYAALVIALAATPRGSRWLAWAEPIGRMAFTNYILQSVVLGVVFYGYGFGLFGKLDLVAGLALVFAVYVTQVVASRWWLKRFRYGPLEWLWRVLMYGAPPRLRAPGSQSA